MSRSDRAVFRLPGVALIIPFLLFVCVTPLANAGADFWLALYVLPAGGLAYLLLTQTAADAQSIRTRGLLGGRRIAWADLDGLEFHGTRWAIAVATSGRRVRLPMVRPRDLPRLAQVSGGRLLLGRDAPAEPAAAPVNDESAAEQADTDQVETDQVETDQVDTDQVDTDQVDTGQVDTGQVDTGQVDIGRGDVQQVDVAQANIEQTDIERSSSEQKDIERFGVEQRADTR